MANEIIVSYPTGNTLYAIILRSADRLAWDNAHGVFTAWQDSNYLNYIIPLTGNVDSTYTADMPPIANGNYTLSFYLQATSSPLLTDTVLDAYTFDWTTATVGLDPYALTDLQALKDELKITNDLSDGYLTQIINYASSVFEQLCDDRKIMARDWTEIKRVTRSSFVTMQYPINEVYSIGWSQKGIGSISYAGTNEIDVTYKVLQSPADSTPSIKITITDVNGNETYGIFSSQIYKSTVDMANAIKAAYPQISWNPSNNKTADFIPSKPISILNKQVETYVIANNMDYCNVIPEWGEIGISYSCMNEYCQIRYNAGYLTIPNDVKWWVTTFAKGVYLFRASNPQQKSVSFKDYSYSIGNDSDLITPSMREILNMWQRKCLA